MIEREETPLRPWFVLDFEHCCFGIASDLGFFEIRIFELPAIAIAKAKDKTYKTSH
jgi:hypothetical protein